MPVSAESSAEPICCVIRPFGVHRPARAARAATPQVLVVSVTPVPKERKARRGARWNGTKRHEG